METLVYAPKFSGPCAKAVVVATLTTLEGDTYQSSNFCMTPQISCPREQAGLPAGEGYHLCKTVCNQVGHAEENVIYFAKKQGSDVRGATIEVDYTWICPNCKKISEQAGINVKLKEEATE